MLRSKQQVDKHVSSILCSLRDDRERLNKHYQIARMYFEIKEYDTAKRYLEGYVSHREDFAPAFKLMGQILETQGYAEKAIVSYRRSLDLDDKQKTVLVKICELYCDLDVDPERARYWAERVEKTCPNHEVAFKLKERAIQGKQGGGSEGQEELELLLTGEMVKNPKDVGLRIKLLQLYLNCGRVNEAYEHVVMVERTVAFTQSLPWYQCVLDVLQVYKRENEQSVNGVYHQMLIHALNSLTAHTLEHKPVAEAIDVLFRFDQTLYDVDNQAIHGDQWTVLLREMQAQLFCHIGTYLLKKAQQGRMSWKEATDYASACYLCSATYKPPLKHSPWYATAAEEDRKLLDYWWQAAHYRCSQIGHMINELSGGRGNAWMQRIDGEFCTDQGKQKIFANVFTLPNMKEKKTSSYLIKNTTFTIIAHEMPRDDQLADYDHVAYGLRADDLHSLVWTALQSYRTTDRTQPDYQMRLFESLQYGVLSLETGVLETLSQLDTEAFIIATVYVCALKLSDLRHSVILEPGQPSVLPAALMPRLVTEEQNNWWEMARKVANETAKDQFSKMRLTLQRGLEVVRMVGNHGLSLDLVVHLARTFEERTQASKVCASDMLELANDVASLEERAKKYWSVAVDMAEKARSGQSMPPAPRHPMFDSPAVSSEQEQVVILEEARYHTALYTMEAGKTEEAIQMFDKVHTPEASFYQGKLYVQLATHQLRGEMLEQTEGEDRTTQVALLTKARESFYMTLDRLRGDRFHKLNADLANEIEDVECKLNLLEGDNPVPRTADTSLTGVEVDESVIPHASTLANMRSMRGPSVGHSMMASTPRRALDMSKAANTSGRNFAKPSVTSTMDPMISPSRVRPSPERLEAQMRQFTHTQDTMMMALVEELKDRRREMQDLQEKYVTQGREKNQMMERVFMAEKERDRAVVRIERITEQQQDLDDGKKRLAKKEEEFESYKQRLSEERREVQLEKERHGCESRRLEDDWKRLSVERERVEREGRGLEEKRGAIDRQREDFEAEKKKLEKEKKELEEEKKKLEKEKKDFEEEKRANQRVTAAAPPASTAPGLNSTDLYNLRQSPFPHHGAFDYLMHSAQFGGYHGQSAYPGGIPPAFPGSVHQGFGYPGPLAAHGTTQRGPGDVAHPPTTQTDTDALYYEEEEDDENNGLVAGQGSLAAHLSANYMFTPPSIPPIFGGTSVPGTTIPMPGPGFFASPDRSQTTAATSSSNFTSQISPLVLGGTVTAATTVTAAQTAGKPATTAAPETSSALAAMLTTSAMVSQVQGAALYSALAGTITSPSANTKFPMSMPAGAVGSTGSGTSPALNTSRPELEQQASQEADDDLNGSYNDGFHDPHFEPIVTLAKVDVKTGEEGEKILYECRAKLYRFVDNQWKERGIGQIKLLHKETEGKVRVVMRREQVLKVCANHFIQPDMEISERDSAKSYMLTWRAFDHADEEARVEQFCLKVKTVEIQQEFKAHFQKACQIVKSAADKNKEPSQDSQMPTAVTTSTTTATKEKPSLADQFKPVEGSWTCDGCALVHKPDTIQCPCCETVQPGREADVAEKKKSEAAAGSFKFASTGGFQFGSGGASPFGGLGSRAGSTSSFSSMQSGGSFGFGQNPVAKSDTPASTATDANGNDPASVGDATPSKTSDSVSSSGVGLVTTIPKPGLFSGFKPPAPLATASSASTGTTTKPVLPVFGSGKAPDATSTESVTTTKSTADNKHLFGGFTFAQMPDVAEKAAEKIAADTKDAETKPKPFAGFSFGSTVGMTPTKATTEASTGKTSIFGGNVTASEQSSFAGLSKSGDDKAFPKGGSGSKAFVGTPLFGSPATRSTPAKEKVSESEGADVEFEPEVDFQPIVQLEEVQAKTGEEQEEVLFEERSKLYRFDLPTKTWKERGIGQLKILKQKQQIKFRIIMRREQVLKLCANHLLTKDSRIQSQEGSDKMVTWLANDYAEQELKQEMLAAKFKTPELTQQFKSMFEECVQKLAKAAEEDSSVAGQPVSSAEVSSSSTDDKKGASLGDLFKPKVGEWECQACLVRNPPTLKQCPACETVKPGCEAEVSSTTNIAKFGTPQKQPGFSMPPAFGSTTSGFQFGSPALQDIGGTGATTTSAPLAGGFSFGSPAVAKKETVTSGDVKPKTTTPEKQGPLAGGFRFGVASASPAGQSPFNFTKSPAKDQPTPSSDDKAVSSTTDGGTAGSFGVTNFSFSGLTPFKDTKPKSPVKFTMKSPLKSPGVDGEYYADEGDGEHIEFEPIVTLPDDYDHQTGEESEEAVYCRKAKLFRFTEGQWKERGVGELKILKHKETEHVRLLMRRDQVHKVCLNHGILPSMELKPMAGSKGKAYVWHAQDFSEGQLVHEQFAARFKSEAIASEFKECFDNAKTGKPVKMTVEEDTQRKKSESENVVAAEQKKAVEISQQPSEQTEKPKTFADAFTFQSSSKPAVPSSTFEKSGFGAGFSFGQKAFNFGDQSQEKPSASTTGWGGLTSTPGQGFNFGSKATTQMVDTTVTSDSRRAMQNSLLADLLTNGETGADATVIASGEKQDDSDVIFVSEKLPTPDQAARAKQFMLPASFYFYEDSDFRACKGCIGCDPDAFNFGSIGQPSQNDDDVIFLYEEKSSPSKQTLLDKYQLPDNFYIYEHKAGCSGCPGCQQNEPEAALIQTALSFLSGDSGSVYQSTQSSHHPTLSPEEEIIQAAHVFVSGDRGNVHYAKELKPKLTQPEVIVSSQTFVTGDRGNVDYAKELEAHSIKQEVITPSQAFVTGDRGNVDYAKELEKTHSSNQEVIVPSQAFVTGDRGNVDYAKELEAHSTKQEVIAPSQAFVTGDRGNVDYAKELEKAHSTKQDAESFSENSAATKQEADSTTDGSSSMVFGNSSSAGGFDFASLAGNSGGQSFGFGKKQDGKPFEWQGAGQSLFNSPGGRATGGGATGGEEEDVEREAEVTFEPVVQLAEVEVTTGEEDEEVLYAQRAKLYRYDNNQWKERGVGEAKILRHKKTGRYRLLQRREQVHKICCNQAISVDMQLTRMQTSETAWCWYGMDNSDAEPKLEQFALRFKTIELAKSFYDHIHRCKERLVQQEIHVVTAEPANDSNGPGGDASTVDYADYESEEEQNTVFNKRATLFYVQDDSTSSSVGMGDLAVTIDDDIQGFRISMRSDARASLSLCNHVICSSHAIQKNEAQRFVEWTAKDFSTDEPIQRTFRAQFSSSSAVREFVEIFQQGVVMARESGLDEVTDTPPLSDFRLPPPRKVCPP